MPQPLKKKAHIGAPWVEPDERAECAVQMAAVIVSWTQVETQLANLMAAASGYVEDVKTDREDGSQSSYRVRFQNQVSRAALSAIDSLHARIAVVKAIWDAMHLPEALLVEFEAISRMIRKAAGWRNLVAHSDWHASYDFPHELIHPEERKRYNAKVFMLMRFRIREVGWRIQIFQRKCVKLLESRPGRPRHYGYTFFQPPNPL
jgi:hypothetical protein